MVVLSKLHERASLFEHFTDLHNSLITNWFCHCERQRLTGWSTFGDVFSQRASANMVV
jgi:hypothetical protein